MNLGTLIGLLLGIILIGTAAFMSSIATGVSLTALIDEAKERVIIEKLKNLQILSFGLQI